MSIYETCWWCEGSGLEVGISGEPAVCHKCHGDTVLRARDEKGRFISSQIDRDMLGGLRKPSTRSSG